MDTNMSSRVIFEDLEARTLLSAAQEQPAGPPHAGPVDKAAVIAPLSAATAAVAAGRAWTVMVYLDADNNLESFGIADVNEMEAALSSDQVTVLVEMDRIGGYDASNGNWTDTRIGVIRYDQANTKQFVTPFNPVSPAGNSELDMGDPNTLTQFIRYSATNYPATNYALVLWDHGGGLSGVCWDDSNGGDNLTVKEVGSAIAAAGVHLNVVGFDTCLAGLYEQFYQVGNARDAQSGRLADVVVASEKTVPGSGWDYTGVLKRLTANPAMGAEDLGRAIVSAYGEFYRRSETMAATRTSAYAALSARLTDFADAAMASTSAADWSAILSARSKTPYFTDTSYRDLVGFLSGVAASGASQAIRTAARNVIAAVTDPTTGAVIANYSGRKEAGTGISIYLPASGQGTTWLRDYTGAKYDLAADTRWDEFVNVLVTKKSTGGKAAAGSPHRSVLPGPRIHDPLPPYVVSAGAGGAPSIPTSGDAAPGPSLVRFVICLAPGRSDVAEDLLDSRLIDSLWIL